MERRIWWRWSPWPHSRRSCSLSESTHWTAERKQTDIELCRSVMILTITWQRACQFEKTYYYSGFKQLFNQIKSFNVPKQKMIISSQTSGWDFNEPRFVKPHISLSWTSEHIFAQKRTVDCVSQLLDGEEGTKGSVNSQDRQEEQGPVTLSVYKVQL